MTATSSYRRTLAPSFGHRIAFKGIERSESSRWPRCWDSSPFGFSRGESDMLDDFVPAHGGQLREIARRFHVSEESLLDFSASISPVPPSDAVVTALCELLRGREI